jgi:hypothetical protein
VSSAYQLSKTCIERLEIFKRDIKAGNCDIKDGGYYSDGAVMYYSIENKDSATCCFDCDRKDVTEVALWQIKNTIFGGIEKRINSDDRVFYCSDSDGVGLDRTDITTPAQRALELLGNRLKQRASLYE